MSAVVFKLADFAPARALREVAPTPQRVPRFHALIVIVPSLGRRSYHLDRGVIRVARAAWEAIRAGLERDYVLTPAGAYGTDDRYQAVAVTGRATP